MARRVSISTKINLSLLLLVFLPVCAVLVLIYHQVKLNTTAWIGQRLGSLITAATAQLEGVVAALPSQIEGIASDSLVVSPDVALATKIAQIRTLAEIHGFFDDIVMLDLKGNVLASSKYGFDGESWAQTWWHWGEKDLFIAARGGETQVAEMRAQSSPFWYTIFAATPVRGPDEKVIAVLAGKMDMQRIWDITGAIDRGKTGVVFLTNRDGVAIAHSEEEAMLKSLEPEALKAQVLERSAGVAEYGTMGGFVRRICSFGRVVDKPDTPQFGWILGVSQEVKENSAMVDKLGKQVLAISIGGFVFLFILGGFLGHHIVAPIKSLVGTTEQITSGNLKARSEIKNLDEIGELARSFNKMTQDLHQTIISRDLEITARKEAQELLRDARFQQDFSGLLNIISISDVIQLINASRKSGTLEIRKFPATVIGTLSFLEGEIVASNCNGQTGEEGVYALLRSKGEEFHFSKGTPKTHDPSIKQKTMGLLMEGLRLIDEA